MERVQEAVLCPPCAAAADVNLGYLVEQLSLRPLTFPVHIFPVYVMSTL